jgi:uncharacterized protein with PIN domain
LYTASFRFYAELNDFLPTACRQAERELRFHGQPAVKDAIESLGVPHTEVDLILINGAVAGFTDLLHHGDRVSVYPVFESLDIGAIARLRPRPLREPRFILDVHLGRLATFLRLLGFDAEYANSYDDLDLAERSIQDERILLTRDRGLLKRAEITRGYCVRSEDPKSQIREVVARFDLLGCLHPFTRCLVCNGILEDVPKAEVVTSLPTRVSELNERFTRCGGCGRVFWEGTHFERLNRFVEAIVAEASLKGGEG